jgi:vancomycin permeability regulator SanA
VIAFGFAAAATVVVGTNAWVRADVGGRAYRSVAEIPARALAIVPGAPTSSRQVKATLLGRLEGALDLYRNGKARAVLVSGIDSERDPQTSAMRSWLEQRGVPAHDIVSDDRGTRTRETMYRAMHTYSIDQAIVCTERLHMPRTLFLAKQNGIDAIGFELASPLSGHPKFVAIEALKTTLAVFEETFGSGSDGGERTALR